MTKLHEIKHGNCLDEATLAAYLGGELKGEDRLAAEKHLAACHLCLESLRTGYLGDKLYREGKLPASRRGVINKAKGIVKMSSKKRHLKGRLWLLATITAFVLSFTIPRYFAQFLAAAVILGLKWVSESESLRTLIVSMDTKRRYELDKERADEERDVGNRRNDLTF